MCIHFIYCINTDYGLKRTSKVQLEDIFLLSGFIFEYPLIGNDELTNSNR